MADARLGQTDPSSLIGRSAVAPQSNKALADLTKGAIVQQLTNKGGLDRQALANVGSLNVAGLPLGLNPQGSDFPRKLEDQRTSVQAESGGKTAANLVSAGIRVNAGKDFSFTPGQIKNLPFKGGFLLPGGEQSANLPRNEVQATQGAETSVSDIVGPKGKRVGITAQRTVKGTSEVKGKQRQTPLAKEISTDLLNAAKAQFPGTTITADSFDVLGDGTILLTIEINGQTKRIVVGKP